MGQKENSEETTTILIHNNYISTSKVERVQQLLSKHLKPPERSCYATIKLVTHNVFHSAHYHTRVYF